MFEPFLGVNPWTALVTLVNTVLLFYVAGKYLFRPVMKIIEDRQKEIDEMYADAGQARENAETLETACQQRLSTASATADRIVKDAVDRARVREEQILHQARQEAAAVMDRAAAVIDTEKKQALESARDEISDMAIAIAQKVVSREVNRADQKRFIEEFLEGLGDGP